jgi:hypothetical protein
MKVLVATLVVAATALAPFPAQAKQAPVLTVGSVIDPADPQVVPVGGTDTERIGFTVATTEAASVTANAAGPGLAIGDPDQVLAATSAKTAYFTFDVAATTPGFHALTVTVSATGATPAQVTLPYVWADGSPAFPATGSLAGRAYGWQGAVNVAGLESSVRDTEMISFVSPTMAYLGLPRAGQPKCTTAGKGCLAYAFDASTGLVQVGTGIVGRVVGDGLHTDGFVPADEQDSELFADETFTRPLSFAKSGSRLNGTWRYSDESYPDGLVYELVTFRPNATYELAFRVDDQKTRNLSGIYRIGKRGKITFRSKGRVAQTGTLALVGPKVGKAKPAKLGIWLILSGPNGKRPDGNLLAPVKKK